MNGNEESRTYVEHLRIEHSHIDELLEQLQHLIGNAVAWSKENPAPALLAGLIQLREQLVHHFREEEEGGCLEEARSLSPSLSKDVQALQAEHVSFLATLDRLIGEAEVLTKQRNTLPTLQQSFHTFLQQLHAHEAEENRILLFGFGSPAMETLS